MAVRREQLSPVDGFDNRIDWQGAMDRWNQRALRWVLGPGFLSCHLTAFGLSFLTLLTWNLIADPFTVPVNGANVLVRSGNDTLSVTDAVKTPPDKPEPSGLRG